MCECSMSRISSQKYSMNGFKVKPGDLCNDLKARWALHTLFISSPLSNASSPAFPLKHGHIPCNSVWGIAKPHVCSRLGSEIKACQEKPGHGGGVGTGGDGMNKRQVQTEPDLLRLPIIYCTVFGDPWSRYKGTMSNVLYFNIHSAIQISSTILPAQLFSTSGSQWFQSKIGFQINRDII